ncbi:hypothetical protein LMG31886_05300 [Xanthomonas hydrangeae]|nr:hypothetical protein LMG31886_05300 [Xanthomonas hydrangeae]CAD7723502.1 hypothetical protein LMG31886_05300 [Xanthomonas hydrangeae]CAD7726816.1 hypothetical protein LMG31885_10200 [Xanthomonas hydrangeae]CAD7726820.1 hypothetical protein LMG31885_10200 [Xanthomonas hydrangeae]
MKLSSNIGTSPGSRATSPAPARPTHAEETVTLPQTRLPTGPLAGLPSSGPVLRGRREPVARRVTTDANNAESSLGASHRSESSQSFQSSHSSESTDAAFYTPHASPTSSVVDAPHAPAVATTYAQRGGGC